MTNIMMIMLIMMIMIVSLASMISADSPPKSPTDRLREKLLDGYDKMSLPQRNHNDTTNLFFGIALMGMWIEEDKQILNVNAWARMTWTDERLMWDYKDYGELKNIHLADHEIWQPDIYLYNNADTSSIDHYANTHAIAYSDGTVLWVPPATFRVECALDFTHWPYDTQSCQLYIGSWTAHGWQINLKLFNNDSRLQENGPGKYSNEWKFIAGKIERQVITYPCCPEPYITLIASIKMKRISATFTFTIVIPACVISAMTLLQFLLPVREKKRLLLGCCSSLLTLLELLYLATSIPHLSTSTPIIVKFFGQTLVLVALSMVVTTILLRLTDIQHPAASTPPPNLLKTILTGPLASVLFLQHYTEKIGRSGGGDEDGEVVLDDIKNSVNYGADWLLVAALFDRLAAIGFLVTFVVTLISYVASV